MASQLSQEQLYGGGVFEQAHPAGVAGDFNFEDNQHQRQAF